MPVRPLPAALAAKAQQELNEDPNRLQSDLEHIKDWIAQHPHLRARTEDQWLVAFLRGCKFSLERTKQKIELYYSIRNRAPEMFKIKHSDPMFKELLNSGSVLILAKTVTPDSPRIQIIRPGAYDAEKFHILDVMGVSYLFQQIFFMEDDNAVVSGIETVLDLAGVTWGHFIQMTPNSISKMVMASQDAAPIRLGNIHILNTPPGFETIFNAISSLLNEKNRKRLLVHNQNFDAMYKLLPQDLLPQEYGGKQGSFQDIIDVWQKKAEQYSSLFEDDEKYGYDGPLRGAQDRADEDVYGAEGSFRKLQVD